MALLGRVGAEVPPAIGWGTAPTAFGMVGRPAARSG
jgi:hypothetical protein